MIQEWTERVVAAYVVLFLREHGVIDHATAKEAARVLRLTTDEFLRGGRRDLEVPRLSASWRQPTEAPTGPKHAGPRGTQTFPNRREGTDGPERRCTKCRQWKPADLEHFAIKSREPVTLRSWCRPCWSAYQRDRYLTTAKEQALESAGLTFVLDDDPHLACAKCGRALRAGDEVTGEVRIAHVACGGAS